MRLRTLQRPRFSLFLLMGWALTMKTLERQLLHSNAERWNDESRKAPQGSACYHQNLTRFAKWLADAASSVISLAVLSIVLRLVGKCLMIWSMKTGIL